MIWVQSCWDQGKIIEGIQTVLSNIICSFKFHSPEFSLNYIEVKEKFQSFVILTLSSLRVLSVLIQPPQGTKYRDIQHD